MSLPSITTRVSIAWESDEASEPTSTLILSAPNNRFVDVRILVDPSKPHGLDTLQAANAGTAIYTTDSDTGKKRGTWTHEIDYFTDEEVLDTGLVETLENGDVLEKGSMVDPMDGRFKTYSEIWHSESTDSSTDWTVIDSSISSYLTSALAKRLSTLLGTPPSDHRVLIIRVGRYIQGVVKSQSKNFESIVFRAELSESGTVRNSFHLGDVGVLNEMVELVLKVDGSTR